MYRRTRTGLRRGARWAILGTIGAAGALSVGGSADAASVATFHGGVLTVFGDNASNTITLSRNAAGTILVNGGAIHVVGGTPTVANTSMILVFAQAGNDTIRLDESNGALPRTSMFGADGNDVLGGGAGNDLLFGGAGNDALEGRGGFDTLFGGAGGDTLTAGDADDRVFGESGDDTMIWNPGDDTDLNEGGAGDDLVQVNGGGGVEQFTATANGTRVRFDRVSPAPFSIDIGGSERLSLAANGGDDSFSATGDLVALIKITADGGPGADILLGSNGADLLLGGDGDDFVDGQQGADTAFTGSGDDTFQWDPGDGNDVIEGQDGTDTMVFNGSSGNERFEATATGERLRFTRDLGNIVMDTNNVEVVDLRAFGGADATTVNDLSGTDVARIAVDLTSAGGDADTVTVNGTNGDDAVSLTGVAGSASVAGLAAAVDVSGAESADRLAVNTLAGNDVVDASTLAAGAMQLMVTSADGDDVLVGGDGNDVLVAGAGDDVVIGGIGDDVLDGGAGEDALIGGGGNDIFIGGEIIIQGLVGPDTGRLAALDVVTAEWVASHVQIVDGVTVISVNGRSFRLGGVDLSQLLASSTELLAEAQAPGSIGDLVWVDADGNGVQDQGEPGLGGVEIRLVGADGSVVAKAVTDGNGRYELAPPTAGEFTLEVAVPDGFGSTLVDAGDDTLDSDLGGANGDAVVRVAVSVVAGVPTGDVDAGFVPLAASPTDPVTTTVPTTEAPPSSAPPSSAPTSAPPTEAPTTTSPTAVVPTTEPMPAEPTVAPAPSPTEAPAEPTPAG